MPFITSIGKHNHNHSSFKPNHKLMLSHPSQSAVLDTILILSDPLFALIPFSISLWLPGGGGPRVHRSAVVGMGRHIVQVGVGFGHLASELLPPTSLTALTACACGVGGCGPGVGGSLGAFLLTAGLVVLGYLALELLVAPVVDERDGGSAHEEHHVDAREDGRGH